MSKKPILVNENELRKLIDGLDLKVKQKNEYLEARWLNCMLWCDAREGCQAPLFYAAQHGSLRQRSRIT